MTRPSPIPDEWRDPHHVLPHLAEMTRRWHTSLLAVDVKLEVVQGSLDPGDGEPVEPALVLQGITDIRNHLHELTLEVGGRALIYQAVADELQKEVT